MFTIECAIGGLQKCPKSIRSGDTFIVDFDDVSVQKYGQLIIVMIIVMFVNGYGIRRYSER